MELDFFIQDFVRFDKTSYCILYENVYDPKIRPLFKPGLNIKEVFLFSAGHSRQVIAVGIKL